MGDGDLVELVKRQVIDDDEAAKLGFGVSLYRLLDESTELISAVREASIDNVPGKRVTELRDLTALGPDDWNAVLRKAKVDRPSRPHP